jgi:hypothetical protein
MKELSWQEILEAQQKDFIKRLASHFTDQYYLDILGYTPAVLSCLTSNLETELSYQHLTEFGCAELVTIDLDDGKSMDLDNFCNEMVYKYGKYRDIYINRELTGRDIDKDYYMNWMIGKLGEIAAKRCLGNLVSDINYKTEGWGDGGIDFQLVGNKDIGIQVKTKARYRLPEDYRRNENEMVDYIHEIDIERHARFESLESHVWSLNQKEVDTNQIIICLLMLNGIQGDKIYDRPYDFVMAGFLPSQNIKDNKNKYFIKNKYQIKIKDLLYSGGMRGYLEFLGKS